LSQGTRPDLSTITTMLAKHQNKPNDSHIASAKHAIKYLKGTKSKGISFNSDTEEKLTSYLHFPVTSKKLVGISDANWGPQDQSAPNHSKPLPELELFKTRSISGHVITLFGPVHWTSKRQKITARSSCEAEIYATDECVKDLIHLRNIIKDLMLEKELLHKNTTIYNDNMACVLWSKNTTTKGLRHLQIRENAIRETKFITIEHICGKINPADLFTKEDKDAEHFQRIRDTIVVQLDQIIPITEEPIPLQVDSSPGDKGSNVHQDIPSNKQQQSSTNIPLPTYTTKPTKHKLDKVALNIKIMPKQQSKPDLTHKQNQNVNNNSHSQFTSVAKELLLKSTVQSKPPQQTNADHLSENSKHVSFDDSKNEIKIFNKHEYNFQLTSPLQITTINLPSRSNSGCKSILKRSKFSTIISYPIM